MRNEMLGDGKWVTLLVSILLNFIYMFEEILHLIIRKQTLNKKIFFSKWGLSYVFNYSLWPR